MIFSSQIVKVSLYKFNFLQKPQTKRESYMQNKTKYICEETVKLSTIAQEAWIITAHEMYLYAKYAFVPAQ
jgi:hypothetical protein